MEPEYLSLFSNAGNFRVQVRLKNSLGPVRDLKMEACEIQKLLNSDGKSFISKMRFDDHLAELEKIEIFFANTLLILHARFLISGSRRPI